MTSTLPGTRLHLVCALALLLASLAGGCGGGGGDGDGTPPPAQPVVLFEDTFDGPFPGDLWLVSGPGGSVVDVEGEPALSLGDAVITADAAPFTRNGKILQLFVFVAWPEGCPAGPPASRPALEIVDTDTDTVVAVMSLVVLDGCATLEETYVIHPDGVPSVNTVESTTEWVPDDFGYAFHDYGFVVEADGTAFWSVDGEIVIEATVPFLPSNLGLRLGGQAEPSLPPILFDDVLVQRQ